jgi:hypothetical protein
MRVVSRIALFVAVVFAVSVPTFADHLTADCPLTLVGSTPASSASNFNLSPHGVFRFGSQVFVLRGGLLSTYTVTDLGDLQLARPDDAMGSLAARESNGGVAFGNGFLFISSEAGLEIFDLRNVRAGGNPPLLVSRTPGLHYRRLAVNGNTLAALFPATDLPCQVRGQLDCFNQIDLYNVTNLSAPTRAGIISSFGSFAIGFNDIAFNFGYLVAASAGGTFVFNVANPALPTTVAVDGTTPGTFLISNTTNLVAVGNDNSILTYLFQTPSVPPAAPRPFLTPLTYFTTPTLQVNRANPIVFHRQGWIDSQTNRLVTLIDELDPLSLQPARTIAFDAFDYDTPTYEGADPRYYEYISYTTADEVKWNPVTVGTDVFVIGETSGVQAYGACGQMAGRIEWGTTSALICGGAEIHGWVTGDQKITNVELVLDGTSLGSGQLTGVNRIDIPARTPVQEWREFVNLDNTPKGDHLLRAVGTDVNGNRRQFSSVRVFFNGPGANCTTRRRASGAH